MDYLAPGTTPPNQTLYIRGLNDKISKAQLRHLLYCLFSPYGNILDIVALKTMKMRGQAFIVFEGIQESSAAMKALQGFSFLDRPMTIQYARGRSNVLNVVQGSYSTTSSLKRPGEILQTSNKRVKGDHQEDLQVQNRILFVSNLPVGVTRDVLVNLFSQHQGFKEVRSVPGKSDLVFVEYDSIQNAELAKNILDGFKIQPTHEISVEFAK